MKITAGGVVRGGAAAWLLAASSWAAAQAFPSKPVRFIVRPTLGVKTLTEFVAHARSKPGSVNFVDPRNVNGGPVGTVYSKTETVFVALFATFVGHEPLHALAWAGILVCLGGVAILSVRGKLSDVRGVLADLTHKGALYGILSGVVFALAAGGIREASKQLPSGDFLIKGITALATMNTIQVVLMGLYLSRRDRPQLGKVWVNWRSSIWVGIFSVLGSAGWALAMTLENAALVRAVGQIELVFTFIASHVVLKERPSAGEWIGSVAVVGGVVLILIGR